MSLKNKVAIIAGASRGIGKGIAIALGQAGAIVYVSGRTIVEGESEFPGTVHATAAAVTDVGGIGIPVQCDHGEERQVEALFARVDGEQGRLDILVNSASALPSNSQLSASLGKNFWELESAILDLYTNVGMRSYYLASRFAAQTMVAQRSGLIVNVSSAAAITYFLSVAAGVCKAGVDKMTADMAVELQPYNVSIVSIWPGLVKTERVSVLGEMGIMDLSQAESPLLAGYAIAALAGDPSIVKRSGKAFYVSQLAHDYCFTDSDGRMPIRPNMEKIVR